MRRRGRRRKEEAKEEERKRKVRKISATLDSSQAAGPSTPKEKQGTRKEPEIEQTPKSETNARGEECRQGMISGLLGGWDAAQGSSRG